MSSDVRCRVLVADDQPVAVAGTTQLLPEHGVEVCGVVTDLRRLVPVVGLQQPDVVVVETRMGGGNEAHETIAELVREHPDVAVVAFTAALTLAAIDGALDAGCRGVVPKTADASALVHAIDMVRRGERHLHPRAVALLLGRLRDPSPVQPLLSLSPRERAVLLHMAEGRSNRAIGHELGISETTVKTHVAHVLRKLGAADRAQAVGRALRSGVIS